MTTPVTSPRNDLDVVRAALDDTYDILDELGRGGMAIVFRARERALDREVAIKVLPFSLAFDEELVERFQREARLSAQLEHPHIVPMYRVGRSGDVIYFVMKLLRGQSLSARLEQRGRLPAAEVRRILVETASALGHAHARGIVHRDVKPDNIMLDADGRCVMTDFGIARSASESKLTATGMSIGTPRYMSPEQARARDVDGRGDLYSLGIVGYECLTGHVPFDGSDPFAILMHHVQSDVPAPHLMGDEERRLYAVVERLLAKAPEDRYQTAEALIAALEHGAMPAAFAFAGAISTAGGDLVGRAPTSSAALDSALDAGIELLRQQRPKVEAGLALLRRQRPRLDAVVDASVDATRRAVDANAPRVRAAARGADGALARLGAAAGPPLSAAARGVRSRSRRFWWVAAALVVGGYLTVVGGRHLALQRSTCPVVAGAPAGAQDSSAAASAAVPAAPFDVRLDGLGRRPPGRDLDVYYDVCGLPAGRVKMRFVVTKQESGLKRLFNGAEPIVVSYDDEIAGPRARRHRAIPFGDMPAGSYVMDVVVHDGKGRRRAASSSFQVSRQ